VGVCFYKYRSSFFSLVNKDDSTEKTFLNDGKTSYYAPLDPRTIDQLNETSKTKIVSKDYLRRTLVPASQQKETFLFQNNEAIQKTIDCLKDQNWLENIVSTLKDERVFNQTIVKNMFLEGSSMLNEENLSVQTLKNKVTKTRNVRNISRDLLKGNCVFVNDFTTTDSDYEKMKSDGQAAFLSVITKYGGIEENVSFDVNNLNNLIDPETKKFYKFDCFYDDNSHKIAIDFLKHHHSIYPNNIHKNKSEFEKVKNENSIKYAVSTKECVLLISIPFYENADVSLEDVIERQIAEYYSEIIRQVSNESRRLVTGDFDNAIA